ncbi:MAG: hypothetical protein ACKV1O_07150 [Saprospiraceae bacterium]
MFTETSLLRLACTFLVFLVLSCAERNTFNGDDAKVSNNFFCIERDEYEKSNKLPENIQSVWTRFQLENLIWFNDQIDKFAWVKSNCPSENIEQFDTLFAEIHRVKKLMFGEKILIERKTGNLMVIASRQVNLLKSGFENYGIILPAETWEFGEVNPTEFSALDFNNTSNSRKIIQSGIWKMCYQTEKGIVVPGFLFLSNKQQDMERLAFCGSYIYASINHCKCSLQGLSESKIILLSDYMRKVAKDGLNANRYKEIVNKASQDIVQDCKLPNIACVKLWERIREGQNIMYKYDLLDKN